VSVRYAAVSWTRFKKRYDLAFAAGIVVYLFVFSLTSSLLRPEGTVETLVIRATGSGAFLLLHLILSIGPLARLDARFLPLLYNRRHLGVSMFLLASVHGVFSVIQFHALGDLNPLVSVLTSDGRYSSLDGFPFQVLGLAALGILFLMAATSHDFWLAQLSPAGWKTLHLSVYGAYVLVLLHVALGSLQVQTDIALSGGVVVGMIWVFGLHLLAAWREVGVDRAAVAGERDTQGFVAVARPEDIPEGRAHVVALGDERVAVFRYEGKISALSNVCRHQNGPLGEGKIVDGCVTCPWHGYQYVPATGTSPPPFTEKVATFRVAVDRGWVWVDPRPLAPGTPVEPAVLRLEQSR
jgi:nitrite reductase/ring-hydroxylating ferredoxin subunit/DMSO/TMAO reductase YedYZ heme-binding membrane subunit